MTDHLRDLVSGWSPGQGLDATAHDHEPAKPGSVPEARWFVCPACDGHMWGLRTPDGLCGTCKGRGRVPTPPAHAASPRIQQSPATIGDRDVKPSNPAAEASGEMSEDTYIRLVRSLVGKVPDETRAALVTHDAALRARLREAEEQHGSEYGDLIDRLAAETVRRETTERDRDCNAADLRQSRLDLAAATARAKEAEQTVGALFVGHLHDDALNASAQLLAAANAAREKAQRERDEADQALGNLVAVIDRDGGHRRAQDANARETFLRAEQVVVGLRAEAERLKEKSAEWERRFLRIVDIDLCRLQFPDGEVPGNTEECARGWHRWFGEMEVRLRREQEQHQHAKADAENLRAAITRLVEAGDGVILTGFHPADWIRERERAAALAARGK